MTGKKPGKRLKKKAVKKTVSVTPDFLRRPANIAIIAVFIAVAAAAPFVTGALMDGYLGGKWNFKTLFKFPTGKDAIPHIHIKEAYGLFGRKNVVFVDARAGNEYDEAHIKGAVSIPSGSSPENIAKLKDQLKDKILVTYCHGIGCHLSDKTAFALYDAGYRRIKIFFGGWNEWTAAGYPLDKYEPPEQYRHLFTDTAAPQNAQEATAEEVKFLMDKNLGTVADVDTRPRYLSLHPVGAIAFPVEEIDRSIGMYLDLFKQKPVVLYSHGSSKKMLAASEKLWKAGVRKILFLTDALKKWEKAGYPLARPQPRRQ